MEAFADAKAAEGGSGKGGGQKQKGDATNLMAMAKATGGRVERKT